PAREPPPPRPPAHRPARRGLRRPPVPLPAPRSFALLVLARLAACSADVQELVAAASVLGAGCPLHQAAALAKLDDPLPALEQAVAAGLLVEQPTALSVGFPHPLVHPAIYQQLGAAPLAGLHTRTAGPPALPTRSGPGCTIGSARPAAPTLRWPSTWPGRAAGTPQPARGRAPPSSCPPPPGSPPVEPTASSSRWRPWSVSCLMATS